MPELPRTPVHDLRETMEAARIAAETQPAEPPPDVPREAREAAAAWARYYANRTPENLQAAIKESADVYRAGRASGWTWKQIGLAVAGAVVAVLLGVGGLSFVNRMTSEPALPIKDNHDVAKLIGDGFVRLEKTMAGVGVEIQSLGKKIDAKPEPLPLPVDPDKPRPGPKKLTLPERIEVAVGGVVKVKATGASDIQWAWRDSPGLDIDKHGATLYVSAEKNGTYWVHAYTSVNGKIGDIASCMIVAGKGPQPPPEPPGPKPEPQPPTPKDWPTTVPGMRVLIVFEEMERHSLSAGQRAIINGAPIRDHLDSVCVGDGQWKAWRIWDKDIGLTNAEPHWKAMMARPRASVPWVVISNYPKAVYEGVLPSSVEEFKVLIQKAQ